MQWTRDGNISFEPKPAMIIPEAPSLKRSRHNKDVTNRTRRIPYCDVYHTFNHISRRVKIEIVHLNRYFVITVDIAIRGIDFTSAFWWINRGRALKKLRNLTRGV
jgi:hypothetical protein